jgi:hypothetical protein
MASVATAASPATGDALAIAFYDNVVHAYDTTPALTYTESGLVTMKSQIGKKASTFRWNFGRPIGTGFVAARERGVTALSGGRVVWVHDLLDPVSQPTTGARQRPFEVVANGAGLFGRFRVPGKRFACFFKLTGGTPFPGVGHPWIVLSGNFGPLDASGDTARVGSSYPFDGRTATELDTVSTNTKLIKTIDVQVSAASAAKPAFAFAASYGYPAATPAAPRITVCKK